MKRLRFFTCLVYKNACSFDDLVSTLENWEFIKGFVISPLHTDAENNHWHIVIRTCDQTTIENLVNHCRNEVPNTIHNNYFQAVLRFDSIIDYLTHANQKEKTQYDVNDCYVSNFPQAQKVLNGYAKKGYVADLLCYIDSCDFTEVWSFFNFLYREDVSEDFVSWCVAHSSFINQLITSRRYSLVEAKATKDVESES